MSELNFHLLEENIRMLMEKNNMTQQKLAEITGMTQANISKALNHNEKKRFTLDQVYRISQYFEVSIDSLVGNPSEKLADTSPRDAFTFITKFLCAGNLRTENLTITETVYDPQYNGYGSPECTPKEIQDTYPVFFFPDYIRFSDQKLSEQEEIDLHIEFCSCGNSTRFQYLNEILKKMIPLISQYKDGDIPEEAFQMIVDGYLKQLPEK
ncbi:MAG: helix-turn-helix domain-containing protein [Ruminococcus sp.]|nr:helix-turn-helix domain-containing protein [Ruminococcus sp.]